LQPKGKACLPLRNEGGPANPQGNEKVWDDYILKTKEEMKQGKCII
jgi:hypothetical protein